MKIQSRVLILVLVSVSLPVIIVAALALTQFKRSTLEQYQQTSLSEMRQIDNGFSFYLNGLASTAEFLSNTDALRQLDSSVASYVEQPPTLMTPEKNGEKEARAYQLLKHMGESRSDLAYIYLGLSNGSYIQWPASRSAANYDPRKRPWYDIAKSGSGKAVRVPSYADITTGSPLLDYVTEFKTENGLTGVVGVDVTLKKLTNILRNVRLGESGYVVLVEDTGTILADPADSKNNFKNIEDAEALYSRLSSGQDLKNIAWNNKRWFVNQYVSPETGWKFIGVVPEREVLSQIDSLRNLIIFVSISLILCFGAIGYWLSLIISRPIKQVTLGLEAAASGNGDLTKRLPIKSLDETGDMARAFNDFSQVIHDLIVSIKGRSLAVDRQANVSTEISDEIERISTEQSEALEQVATACQEMVSTANEVSRSCNETAQSAEGCQVEVEKGRSLIQQTAQAVELMAETLGEANLAMEELAKENNNITDMLKTIGSIADQTNLLALNAAIESARAGEHGRGFAVVADEVRMLSQKTSASTQQIDRLLNGLTERTSRLSSKLAGSMVHSEASVKSTQQASDVFVNIERAVAVMQDMSIQIATATEEQHSVSEEISRNVSSAYGEAIKAKNVSVSARDTAQALSGLSEQLTELVKQFKTN